ncbi:MAG TPA: efflux RND transporter periplasmic adaptor subunit [Candidatus Binatia bacterium]|nr:efflux RND transporter periplasmic adaptor subunit [Candidatus Binatia bacterium]
MNKRYFIAALLLLGLIVGLTFTFHRKPAATGRDVKEDDPNVVELNADAQKNVNFGLAAVREQKIEEMIKATGVVSPDETRVAHIFPLAQGIAEKPYVRLGDHVQAGQPLLLYDNIELGETVGEHLSLHGEVEKEKAQLEVARKSVERANTLIAVEAISPRDYELRKAEELQAQAAVQSKEAELAMSEEKLHRFGLTEEQVLRLRVSGEGHRTASHNILRAPFRGIITKYDVSQGESVAREKELFTLVDTSSVWVLGDVYEKDLGRIPDRGACLVTVSSYPGERFRGAISYISDFLDPSSRTAKLRCVVPNKDGRLKLEMFADVLIPTTSATAAAVVPGAALQDIDGKAVVFVQRDATHFEKREVTVGERGDQETQILNGVRPGEKVVTAGSFYLKSALMREQIGGED